MSWCIDDCLCLKEHCNIKCKKLVGVFYGVLVGMKLLIGWIILC